MHGPIFANVLLADEINPHAAENAGGVAGRNAGTASVPAGGKRYELPNPFFVLATQNPIEQEGTYPLPEAQLDRFLIKVFVDYPDEAERTIYRVTTSDVANEVKPVLGSEELLQLQHTVRLRSGQVIFVLITLRV